MAKNRTREKMAVTIHVSIDYTGTKLGGLADLTMLMEAPREAEISLLVPYLEDTKYINLAKVVEGVVLETVAEHAAKVRGLYNQLDKETREKEEKKKGQAELGLVWESGDVDPGEEDPGAVEADMEEMSGDFPGDVDGLREEEE